MIERSRVGRVLLVAIAGGLVVGTLALAAATFDYSLPFAGTATGTHLISLPFAISSPAINDCGALLNPANFPNVVAVRRFNRVTDTLESCACPTPNCFPIVPGEAYFVQVSSLSDFSIEGSDGSSQISLVGPSAGVSATGTNVVALPFGTSITNAGDLVASVGGFGVVTNVQRYLPATDTFEIYGGGRGGGPNFPVEPGRGYVVKVNTNVNWTPPSFGGSFCDSPTSCFYQGFENVAQGNATLSLDAQGELVVSNLGTSGNDGVRFIPPPDPSRTGHDPWIDLGMVTTRPVGSTGDGGLAQSRSTTTLSPFGPAPPVLLTVQQIPSGQVQIGSDFARTGATTLRYEVFNGGVAQAPAVSSQPLTSTALASAWPVRHAFSVVQWQSPVTITLPGPTMRTGDELHIIPESPTSTSVASVDHVDFLVNSTNSPGLTSVTIAQQAIQGGSNLPPLPTGPQTVLSVTRAGAGSGTVTSTPAGINCGVDCSEPYAASTVVTLGNTPAVGSTFAGYGGDPDCVDGSVTMGASKTCLASFGIQSFTLTVTRIGSGSGTVTSSPAGINCGGDCSESYNYGTVVTLNATPSAGSVFTGFGGDGDCTDGSVTVTAARSCTASFTLQSYALTVSLAGTGSGSVTSSPPGISCGTDCSENYVHGTSVTLIANASPGSQFAAYGGHTDCTDGQLSMTGARSCTATFNIVAGGGTTPIVVLPALGRAGLMLAALGLLALIGLALRRFPPG